MSAINPHRRYHGSEFVLVAAGTIIAGSVGAVFTGVHGNDGGFNLGVGTGNRKGVWENIVSEVTKRELISIHRILISTQKFIVFRPDFGVIYSRTQRPYSLISITYLPPSSLIGSRASHEPLTDMLMVTGARLTACGENFVAPFKLTSHSRLESRRFNSGGWKEFGRKEPGRKTHKIVLFNNFTTNTVYQANIETALASVSLQVTKHYGFNKTPAGESPNIVTGVALCRGDIGLETCQTCVNDSHILLRKNCPTGIEALVWTAKSDYNVVLRDLAGKLRTKAASGNSLRKFATGDVVYGPDSTKVYALMQCAPDLSSFDCNSCLSVVFREAQGCCDGDIDVAVIFPACFIRYSNVSFYNDPPAISLPAALPPSSTSSPATNGGKRNSSKIIYVVIPVAFVSVGLISIVLHLFVKKTRRKKNNTGILSVVEMEMSTVGSLKFDLSTIEAATNNFFEDNKIGEGGFGPVYKGVLANGTEVAVKRLSKSSGQGSHEFVTEVILMAKLQHRNLVRLLGFCLEDEERILIYEFVPNKSLDHFLFGMAKQITHSKSVKCSLNAWTKWNEGTTTELIDPTMVETNSKDEVMRCINIGLLCVQEDVDARPSMSSVINMLNNYSLTLPSPKRPPFYLFKRPASCFTNSVAMCLGYANEDQCLGCIKTAISLLRQKCPNQKEAVARMQKCMPRYSGHLLQEFDPWFWAFLGDETKVPEKDVQSVEDTKAQDNITFVQEINLGLYKKLGSSIVNDLMDMKSIIPFLCFLQVLINVAANPPAKPPPGEPLQKMNTDVFKCRDGEKYQPGSGFDLNLKLALVQLTSAKQGGWYLKSFGDKPGSKATAVAMCLGYTNEDQCLRCIKTAIPLLRQKCPNQKEAVAWMQKCMLRYTDRLLQEFDLWFWAFLGDGTKVPENEEDIFEKTKSKLMVQLSAQAAARNQSPKYSTDAAAFGSKIIYMAVQCTPDLSQDTCNECFVPIHLAMSFSIRGQVASAMFSPSCYIKLKLGVQMQGKKGLCITINYLRINCVVYEFYKFLIKEKYAQSLSLYHTTLLTHFALTNYETMVL
ncbi:Concanavalin A-like lectin/glucanase, subgroup [Artemisia annua]|uniref:Concanavalin A-like lectin/glucanase, subgroup n=1 Tax=Artemisia annua TaxID=35608 RepID=A0A2U1NHK5_ARTAN|nr:Concanavalin A-like lectin/glucanase, subgroup [Artemisia annua]